MVKKKLLKKFFAQKLGLICSRAIPGKEVIYSHFPVVRIPKVCRLVKLFFIFIMIQLDVAFTDNDYINIKTKYKLIGYRYY